MPAPLLVVLQLLASSIPAAAFVFPRLRRVGSRLMVALAILAGVLATFSGQDGQCSLEVSHAFTHFEGNQVISKDFPVEVTEAPCWIWGAICAVYCLFWAFVLRKRMPAEDDALAQRRLGDRISAFWAPLILAWSGILTMLLLQKAAAPAGLVLPLTWDRVLLPASLAAAVLIGNRERKILPSIVWLVLFVTLSRLPLVIFGTFATLREWGTSLDVHATTLFANPFAQMLMEVEPQGAEQIGWLIWGPHLLIFPALYMLSLAGVAAMVALIANHPAQPKG